MGKSEVHLLLGTNLGDKEENLYRCKSLILSKIGQIEKESIILETEPVDFTSDQKFLNQIIVIHTSTSPIKLLREIKKIEKQMGRVYFKPKKGEKYTSRIIDIDILFYSDIVFFSKLLILPHPQTIDRIFVKEIYKKSINFKKKKLKLFVNHTTNTKFVD